MSSAFTVRTATPADEQAVTDLLAASYPLLMAPAYEDAPLRAALPAMTRANPTLLASGTYYVAELDDGELAGCGGWTHERPGTGKIEPGLAHIRHFATAPNRTRIGVGRALYRRCEKEARAVGIRRFNCFSSLNAEAFYGSLGFEAVRRFDVAMHNGTNLPSILMRRDI